MLLASPRVLRANYTHGTDQMLLCLFVPSALTSTIHAILHPVHIAQITRPDSAQNLNTAPYLVSSMGASTDVTNAQTALISVPTARDISLHDRRL